MFRYELQKAGSTIPEDQKREDLLTSDVFSVLKYAPPEMGLIPVLQRILEINGHALKDDRLQSAITSLESGGKSLTPGITFWPGLKGLKNQTVEPASAKFIQFISPAFR